MKTKLTFNLPALIAGYLAVTGNVRASVYLPLAQATSSLKTAVQTGLGILFIFGFIWGVVNIWGGAHKLKHGDADGKMGIISGIIIAGASAIMTALFAVFGMADGALTPTF